MTDDVLFSDDILALRLEVMRVRTLLDCEWNIRESYRVRCEHLESIIQQLISQGYGK